MNKTALITGSSSGIGLELTNMLLEQGVKVYGVSNQEFTLDNPNYIHLVADIGKKEEIQNIFNKLNEQNVKLDYLAAHAGVQPRFSGIDNITDENIDLLLNVNLKGTFWTVTMLGKLVKENEGSIVLTSSIDGVIGEPYGVMYSATKAAILSLTKSFARYFGKKGIRVNSVAPGLIDTPLTASSGENPADTTDLSIIQRMGTATEVANTMWFLLSDKSSYTTGQNLIVDGGFELK